MTSLNLLNLAFIASLAISAASGLTLTQPVLEMSSREVDYLDCTGNDRYHTIEFTVELDEDKDETLTQVLVDLDGERKVEWTQDPVNSAAPGTVEYNFPFDQNLTPFTHSGKSKVTLTLSFNNPLVVYAGHYKFTALGTQEGAADDRVDVREKVELSVQAKSTCSPGDLDIVSQEDSCTLRIHSGCRTGGLFPKPSVYSAGFFTQIPDPESQSGYVEQPLESGSSNATIGRWVEQKDSDGTYAFYVEGVYEINDSTPTVLKYRWEYKALEREREQEEGEQEGEPTYEIVQKGDHDDFENVERLGCTNWAEFCADDSASPSFPLASGSGSDAIDLDSLDPRIRCEQTNHKPSDNPCRTDVVPKEEEEEDGPVRLVFTCPEGCETKWTEGEQEEKAKEEEKEEKVFTCAKPDPANKPWVWKEENRKGSYPTCDCPDNSSSSVHPVAMLSLLGIVLLKL